MGWLGSPALTCGRGSRLHHPPLPRVHPNREPSGEFSLPGIKCPFTTGPWILLRLKPTHRFSRRFLLIHRQGPRVGGHGLGRRWDPRSSGFAYRGDASVDSGASQRTELRPRSRRGGTHPLEPAPAHYSDVRTRARRRCSFRRSHIPDSPSLHNASFIKSNLRCTNSGQLTFRPKHKLTSRPSTVAQKTST